MSKNILYFCFQVILVLFVFATAIPVFGQALMVNPKRIVFEGPKRNDVVTLFNSTDDSATYAISWLHYEMTQDGKYKDVDSVKTEVKFLDTMVRFFPRSVTLGPRESQTIRLQFLKPRDLQKGEYRSHLYFRGIEKVQALDKPKGADTSISVQLKAIFGISIPIVVRYQTTPSTATLSNLVLTPPDSSGSGKLTVDITRTGEESLYGELRLKHKKEDGKENLIGFIKGMAVYPPLVTRTYPLVFKIARNVDLTKGSLILDFQTLTGAKQETILASATLPLKK